VVALIRQFIVFGIVGGGAFLVDVAVLYLLKDLLGLYAARALSFLTATVFTWLINRSVTFARASSNLRTHAEFARYLLFVLGGGGINLLSYAWLVAAFAVVREHPILAVAAGSVAGMVVNFALLKWALFKH
jgi:putative flippase GtrA